MYSNGQQQKKTKKTVLKQQQKHMVNKTCVIVINTYICGPGCTWSSGAGIGLHWATESIPHRQWTRIHQPSLGIHHASMEWERNISSGT